MPRRPQPLPHRHRHRRHLHRLRLDRSRNTPPANAESFLDARRSLASHRRSTKKNLARQKTSSSSTARQSAPTRCSNAKAPAPRSSPPQASKTPSKSDARPAPSSTTSSSTASTRWSPRISASALNERTAADGEILTAPDAARTARPRRAASPPPTHNPIAISLLFSFANPKNELSVSRCSAARCISALHLPPNPPRIPRIRTHFHSSHQRLPPTSNAKLSGKS